MPIGNYREQPISIFCGDCGINLGSFVIPENAVIFCGDCGMTRINAICEATIASEYADAAAEADCGC